MKTKSKHKPCLQGKELLALKFISLYKKIIMSDMVLNTNLHLYRRDVYFYYKVPRFLIQQLIRTSQIFIQLELRSSYPLSPFVNSDKSHICHILSNI